MSAIGEPIRGSIVFSLVNGTVWASWPGSGPSLELGSRHSVTYMMRDFLAQCDSVTTSKLAWRIVTSDRYGRARHYCSERKARRRADDPFG
jgi:hypothetical protein